MAQVLGQYFDGLTKLSLAFDRILKPSVRSVARRAQLFPNMFFWCCSSDSFAVFPPESVMGIVTTTYPAPFTRGVYELVGTPASDMPPLPLSSCRFPSQPASEPNRSKDIRASAVPFRDRLFPFTMIAVFLSLQCCLGTYPDPPQVLHTFPTSSFKTRLAMMPLPYHNIFSCFHLTFFILYLLGIAYLEPVLYHVLDLLKRIAAGVEALQNLNLRKEYVGFICSRLE